MNHLTREARKLFVDIKIRSIEYRGSQRFFYNVGQNIHGYKIHQIDWIKELNIKPYYLRHEMTGAEHLHIHNNDPNNVFSVSLKTTPKSSNGIAHILEHLALCGSKKYPIRDPFFKMRTRSLATFMNAMTGPDYTIYPFSTQNKRDFENLLGVYTDAVFFPRLRPVDFRQEGWRLEHEKPDRKETPMIIRGVVYNEMKGLFSSSSDIYVRQLLNNLFPDTTYRYESGGDPDHIPELSHQELKKFHQLHYHPTNSRFFTYGDMPLENHLRFINESVLSKFSHNPQASEESVIAEQEPWTESKIIDITCPLDPLSASNEKQTTTSISYMLPTNSTIFHDVFPLQILSTLLIDGPNAPFYKSLVESGLGSDFSPSTGFNNHTKQPYFSIGLQNIHRNDVATVHDIIEKTFLEVASEGFANERVEAILHNIELGLKHISANFGLRLLMSLESTWNHGGDVIDYLRVNKYVEKFKKSLSEDKNFWKSLIYRNFLTNNHKLIMNMYPDTTFETKREEREKGLLNSKISKLNDVDKQTVLYEGMELMKIQDTKDNLSLLPCLEPSKDIPKDLRSKTELKFECHNNVQIQICEQPTNELVYFRAVSVIKNDLEDAGLLDYLPLFCDVATKLGAGVYNRQQFSQKIQLTTSGLDVSLMLNPSLSKFDEFKKEICLSSYCLRRNVNAMFNLWSNVFEHIHFLENKDHLFQLIKQCAADLADGVSYNGQMYAIKKSSSSLCSISSIEERLSGLSYIVRMKDVASKESIECIATKLQRIAELVFKSADMKCAINAEPGAIRSTLDELTKFIDQASQSRSSNVIDLSKLVEEKYEQTRIEDLKLPFATHFVAKSLITVPKLHEDFAKLVIMSNLISSKYLLREVREKGGAYGAGARLSNSGVLNFYSYRDPNTSGTLKIFDHASVWLADDSQYTEKDIEESKLGVFQEVDKPVEPGRRGINNFLLGESDEIRQEYRRRLLNVTKDDVKTVAGNYLNQATFGTHII